MASGHMDNGYREVCQSGYSSIPTTKTGMSSRTLRSAISPGRKISRVTGKSGMMSVRNPVRKFHSQPAIYGSRDRSGMGTSHMWRVHTSDVAPQHQRYGWRMNTSPVDGHTPAASTTGRY